LSRAGLWLFDLAATQIAQEVIVAEYRGVINGQWRSLIAFFDMLTYIVAVVASTPNDFEMLSYVSAASVGIAAVVYTLSEAPEIVSWSCGCLPNCGDRQPSSWSEYSLVPSKEMYSENKDEEP
jgi:iron-regulated transporter 1